MLIRLVNDFMNVLVSPPYDDPISEMFESVQCDLYDSHEECGFGNSIGNVLIGLINRGYMVVDDDEPGKLVDMIVTSDYGDDGKVKDLVYFVSPNDKAFYSLAEVEFEEFQPVAYPNKVSAPIKANPIAHFENAILKFTDYHGDIRLVKCTTVGKCGTYFDGTDLETGEADMRFCVDEDIQGLVEIVK